MSISLLTPSQRESLKKILESDYQKLIREKTAPIDTKSRVVKNRFLAEIHKPNFLENFLKDLIADLTFLNHYYQKEVVHEYTNPDFYKYVILVLLKTLDEEEIRFFAHSAIVSKRRKEEELARKIQNQINIRYDMVE